MSLARDCGLLFPSHFLNEIYLRKTRWLLWLEGTGHRTCLAVQQLRYRQNDKQR